MIITHIINVHVYVLINQNHYLFLTLEQIYQLFINILKFALLQLTHRRLYELRDRNHTPSPR